MKTQITVKQKQQFNQMLAALKRIKAYPTPAQLRKDSGKNWGLDYKEVLEMAYENMQGDAIFGCKGIKELK